MTVIPIAATLAMEVASAAMACAALVVGLAMLLSRRAAVQQTTLTGAWWWALAALSGWAGVELAAAVFGPEGSIVQPLEFAAMALSCCPVVALLGAKRPQHAAWNFVVLSLWAIVALPAAENFFLHRGQQVALGEARGWFLWILILLGPINFLPTRYWLASILFTTGQLVAFGAYLPLIRQPLVGDSGTVGLFLAATAMADAWFASRPATKAEKLDRLWLDFRDTFGLLWALRVQERVNAASRQYGWGVELGWSGFCSGSSHEGQGVVDSSMEPAVQTNLKGLLRRFVSNQWIEDRTDDHGASMQ